MTLNDLERQLLLYRQCYAYCDQMAELESRGLGCKIALYLSYLHINFDVEFKGNSFEFHTKFLISLHPKLNCRLSLALFAARFRSYEDLYTRQLTNMW